MRHRITSFRCVEAGDNMSLKNRERKTCNEVKIRHYLLPSGGRKVAASTRASKHEIGCVQRPGEGKLEIEIRDSIAVCVAFNVRRAINLLAPKLTSMVRKGGCSNIRECIVPRCLRDRVDQAQVD